MRNTSRDTAQPIRGCPVCDAPLPVAQARYCSAACRQRSFRLRHAAPPPDTTALAATLRRRKALAAATVYECPDCQERLLGERRCAACNRFGRAIGLGARCPDCDTILIIADLLPDAPPSPG